MKEIFDDLKNMFWKDERVLEYKQLAKDYSFQFTERAKFAEQSYALKGMRLFRGKRGKRLTGILSEELTLGNATSRIYDYHYYGESKTTKTTVFEFSIPQMDLPKFLIQPKGSFAKLKSFFVKVDPAFIGLDSFYKNYELLYADPNDLRQELNQEFLGRLSEYEDIWVEGEGKYCLFYHKKRSIPLRQLMDHYQIILDLLDRFLNGQPGQDYV